MWVKEIYTAVLEEFLIMAHTMKVEKSMWHSKLQLSRRHLRLPLPAIMVKTSLLGYHGEIS